MRILVVSPHFDDAVFSISENMLGWIADGHQVSVLTVFGAVTNGKETLLEREHHAAMVMLDAAGYVNLPFLDDAHSDDPDKATLIDVRATVREHIVESNSDITVWPFGIHHPDHVVVALMIDGRRKRWIYDELPYFVLYPEQAVDPSEWGWKRLGSRNFLERKRQLVACYASQVGETEERCLFAPERCWKAR